MTRDDVKDALISVLGRVQAACGDTLPPLSGSDVPAKVLEHFDSPTWSVATSWLAKKLDVIIPNDVHIFGTLDGKTLLTINQSIDLVLAKHVSKAAVTVAAE
ncbi:hypothetical protein J1C56_23035 [Aminobacter anthyllidis]|uniref:Uncharacterized protein n=1 Tax=Aminobacter anthyllidis TaxID=1035067 RepID=A0A9X1D6R1_9HYPH|nr:hypothetical protein [Aminobacter anthyllidis]MBT1158477.1 hypothetical protein [Aminobacter anthyllidis]